MTVVMLEEMESCEAYVLTARAWGSALASLVSTWMGGREGVTSAQRLSMPSTMCGRRVDLSVSGGLCLRLSLRSIYLTPTWSTNTKKKKDRERMIERPRLLHISFRFSDIFVIEV